MTSDERLRQRHCYDDIIHLPHHVSSVHPPMPLADRAAQFSPFAALTGYHDAVADVARFTEEKRELDDSEKALLDEKLSAVRDDLSGTGPVTVTYFCPDGKKSGGAYVGASGFVKKIDFYKRTVVMEDGLSIPMDDIRAIDIG